MTRERRLGRGLEALLGRVPGPADPAGGALGTPRAESGGRPTLGSAYGGATEEPYTGAADTVVSQRDIAEEWNEGVDIENTAPANAAAGQGEPASNCVEIRRIDSNPYQPRQDFDDAELVSLCDSIRAHGLLQPLVVRRAGDRYQLIAGERRLRAAVKAGWTDVPVQVVEADDRQMAELAIIENLQRKDLNPLEKAASFQRYLEQYGCTQEELASRLKLDRSTIANVIRLLELPEKVQEALRQGKISQGHARALLPLGDEREQVEFCQRIQQDGLSVRQTETAVQEAIQSADGQALGVVGEDGRATIRTRRSPSEHLAALEQEFRAALGTRVNITHNSRGKGKLVIHFASHEEFARLRAQICHGSEVEIRKQAG